MGFYIIRSMLPRLFRGLYSRTKRFLLKTKFNLCFPNVLVYTSRLDAPLYSQAGQDYLLLPLMIRRLNVSRNRNVIVDVGCNHPVMYSNTYLLEKNFDCRTIAIDPLLKYKSVWQEVRPEAVFVNCAVSDRKGRAKFIVSGDGDNNIVSGYEDMFSSLQGYGKNEAAQGRDVVLDVNVDTLSGILQDNGVSEVLYCSIDTEGNELAVLQGIDFERIDISIFSVENNHSSEFGSNVIRKFMKTKGYSFYARIWGLDDIYIRDDLLSVSGL